MRITIAIANDNIAIRQILAKSLEQYNQFTIIAEGSNGVELSEKINQVGLLPNICLLDLNMPLIHGFNTLKFLKKEYPILKVVVHSRFLEEYNIQRLYKYGANGVITKDMDIKSLVNALVQVHEQGLFIPDVVSTPVFEAIKKKKIKSLLLTERETEFVQLCCQELNYNEIADIMGINPKTVHRYKENVCKKFNIKTRTGIVMFALRTGIAGWN